MLGPAPGVFAWGLVTGIAMVKSGLSVPHALGLSLAAYAGSAQLAALPLILAGAPLWLITVTALVVNLRFVVYSALVREYFRGQSTWRRLWLGYIIGDITLVQFMTRMKRQDPPMQHGVAYYVGSAACNWLAWQISSILGILTAGSIPQRWGLELAGTLALIALVVPLCAQLPALAGVIVAGIVAVLAHGLPLKLGMLAGVIAGISAAMWIESSRSTTPGRNGARS